MIKNDNNFYYYIIYAEYMIINIMI